MQRFHPSLRIHKLEENGDSRLPLVGIKEQTVTIQNYREYDSNACIQWRVMLWVKVKVYLKETEIDEIQVSTLSSRTA